MTAHLSRQASAASKALLICVMILQMEAPANGQRRSVGYAGSAPMGQVSSALAGLDCARINATRGLSRMTVPLSADCAIIIPSPDGRYAARTRFEGEVPILEIHDRRTGKARRIRRFDQPMAFRWAPGSDAFMLNDGEGSGQVSRLLTFKRMGERWAGSRRLDRAATSLYLKRYDCSGNRRAYTNVSGMGWTRGGLMRAIVQEGMHSEGCLQPKADHDILLEVIGEPFTGRIVSATERTEVD